MNNAQFAGLNAVVIEQLGPKAAPIEQTVVLLHGYGAPGTDLVGLAGQIASARSTRYVFLQAPHVLPGMTGSFAGRAWWDIDMMQLQIVMMTRNFSALAESHPPGLDEATELLDAAILALQGTIDAPDHALYVGGFSQGAMLSCNWALEKQRPIAGLIQLSGTVLREAAWKAALTSRRGLPVFQSHSPDDPVLPFDLAVRLKKMFETAEVLHFWVSFRGGHGIGPEVLNQLGRFLSRSA